MSRPGAAAQQVSVVPEAGLSSYYGRPILNPPAWASPDIPGYLFLGGLAGASSVLGAAAQLTGRPALSRVAKAGAAGSGLVSVLALVHDLGRPSRFLNMLRVLKVTSPMSVGSWLLSGYVPAAVAAAACDLSGAFPLLGRLASAGAAITGPGVATYTAALVADTAVPAWHDGYRELPYLFAGSAASAAAGLGLLGGPLAENGPARRLALAGGLAELSATWSMERRLGMVAEPYRQGRSGRLMRLGEALTVAGTLGALTLGRRSRLAAGLSGATLLTASACTRFGVFHAGKSSAGDPKYVVGPQRENLGGAQGR